MCLKRAVMDCGASTHATPTLLKLALFMKEKDDFYRFYWGPNGISIREDITQYFKRKWRSYTSRYISGTQHSQLRLLSYNISWAWAIQHITWLNTMWSYAKSLSARCSLDITSMRVQNQEPRWSESEGFLCTIGCFISKEIGRYNCACTRKGMSNSSLPGKVKSVVPLNTSSFFFFCCKKRTAKTFFLSYLQSEQSLKKSSKIFKQFWFCKFTIWA